MMMILTFAVALILARVFEIAPREGFGIGWHLLAWPVRKAWRGIQAVRRALDLWWDCDDTEPAPSPKFRITLKMHDGSMLLNVCTDHLGHLIDLQGVGRVTLWDGWVQDTGRVTLEASKE